jgi:hypothetical protein
MKEIKSQEDVFNNESINFINIEMVKESDQSEFLMKKLKHSFLFKNEKPNRSSSFYGILYRKKGHLPEIFNCVFEPSTFLSIVIINPPGKNKNNNVVF